jgi:hypothetical protein
MSTFKKYLAAFITLAAVLFVAAQLSYRAGRQLRGLINGFDIKGGYLPCAATCCEPSLSNPTPVAPIEIQCCALPASSPLSCVFQPRYDLLTVSTLRPLARAAGIKAPHQFKKAQLITLLESTHA